MQVESSYVVAAVLTVKKKYFDESFVKANELYTVERSMQEILNGLEKHPIIVAPCSSDYFCFSKNCEVIFPLKDLPEIEERYKGYLPIDVLNVIWNENFVIEALFKAKKDEIENAAAKIKSSRSK